MDSLLCCFQTPTFCCCRCKLNCDLFCYDWMYIITNAWWNKSSSKENFVIEMKRFNEDFQEEEEEMEEIMCMLFPDFVILHFWCCCMWRRREEENPIGFSLNVVISSSLHLLVVVACEDEKKKDQFPRTHSCSLHFVVVACEE